MVNDSLGNRMKFYEEKYEDKFSPFIPVIARLDGRSFHNFTKGLKRPYDENFRNLMVATTKYLVSETNARCGYTQSDEITLVWLAEEWDSEIFFAGRVQKMNSLLAAMTTAWFNRNLSQYLPEKAELLPVFDCRVFQVPTDFEASNCFWWREKDATRNSVQMAAQSMFSHHECQNKNCPELQEMMWSQKNTNWNDYPDFFKRGTYVRRKSVERKFNAEELASLPEKHQARLNPNLVIKRNIVKEENFPPLYRVANREEVILFGADPILRTEVLSNESEFDD